jgi:tetratricopeptide (TPR) repeat protein
MSGRPDKSLAALNRAIDLSGEQAPLPLVRRKVRILAVQGDWTDVIRTLRGLAKRRGGRLHRDDVVLLASALYETGQGDRGREQLERLLAEPDPPAVAVLEYVRREGQRDPARTDEVLARAAAAAPDDVQILAQLLRRDVDAKRTGQALARLDAAAARRPDDAGLWLLRGQLLAATSDLAGAEAAGRKALDLAPGLEGAAQFLAGVLASQGQEDEAVATLEAQARVGSLGVSGIVLLGRLQAAAGNRDRAIELFEQALAKQGDLAQVKNDLAYLLLDRGTDLERALALAQEARPPCRTPPWPPTRWASPT